MIRKITRTTGKIPPKKSPYWRLSPAFWEIIPTELGPIEPPRSPAMARRANIAVPPAGIFLEEILKVPGHMMATEKPHMMHPINAATGFLERDARR